MIITHWCLNGQLSIASHITQLDLNYFIALLLSVSLCSHFTLKQKCINVNFLKVFFQ